MQASAAKLMTQGTASGKDGGGPDTAPMGLPESLMARSYREVVSPLLVGLLVALPVLLAISLGQGDSPRESAPIIGLIAAVGFIYWQLRRGNNNLVGHGLVLALIIYTTISLAAYGSVRSPAVIGYVGAIVAAGLLLGTRALAASTLLAAVALTALVWAEYTGHLKKPDFGISLKFWATHVAVLLLVALTVHAARRIVRRAVVEQRAELATRKTIEQELRLSEDRYSRIFRNSPVAIIVQSAQDRVVLDVNPAFERLYGYNRDEYVGTANDNSLWDNLAERTGLAEAVIQQGRVTDFQARGRRKDGSTFDALIAISLEGVGPGQIVVSNIADVSAETRAREAARQSQELFSKAFDFSPLNMAITRVSDGMYLAVNAAEGNVQGYQPGELVGRTSMDVGTWLNPSEREAFVEKLRTTGQALRYETQMRHKDGHLVHCMIWSVVVDIAGEPCVLSSTLNTTEEKRRERQLLELARGVAGETGERFFSLLVEHLANALEADMVLAGEVQDAAQIRSLGLIRDGEQMPSAIYATAGTPIGAVLERAGLYTFEEGTSGHFPHDPLLAGRYAAYAGIALCDGDGTPIGILEAAWRNPLPPSGDRQALFSIFASRCKAELVRLRRDREIQRLNETLEQRVKARTGELQASNAELESFSYSVSHDLKAPLSSIDGFTALLLRRMGARMDAEEQRMFERVRTNVARMHELITALLSLAQVSRYKLELQEVDLSAMAQEWFDAEHARDPQRAVETIVQPNLVAQADRRMARIVMENLLGNAWKYSRRNLQARIEFGTLEKDGAAVLFVRDNGVGFDMDHAAHLFKPFHRLHNVSDYDGSGIGLATVHRILERHGGHIRAEARVDEGATFYFSLEPRAEAG